MSAPLAVCGLLKWFLHGQGSEHPLEFGGIDRLGEMKIEADFLAAATVIVLAIAVPVIAWRALDPSQRRRIKNMRDRGQLGR